MPVSTENEGVLKGPTPSQTINYEEIGMGQNGDIER